MCESRRGHTSPANTSPTVTQVDAVDVEGTLTSRVVKVPVVRKGGRTHDDGTGAAPRPDGEPLPA